MVSNIKIEEEQKIGYNCFLKQAQKENDMYRYDLELIINRQEINSMDLLPM
ncbi:spiroplasma phage ORF1-like family protein [Spiroplasma poulsonii]|uniref:spiroplasma phage ORF1-like family protein n=1 Tax=Spiroplasma poulsonii TaxID=2138 RepID=UPI0038D372E2